MGPLQIVTFLLQYCLQEMLFPGFPDTKMAKPEIGFSGFVAKYKSFIV